MHTKLRNIKVVNHMIIKGYAAIYMCPHEYKEVKSFLNKHSIPYHIELNIDRWIRLNTPTPLTRVLIIIRGLLPKEDKISYTYKNHEYKERSLVRAISFVFHLDNLYMYLSLHGIKVNGDTRNDLTHYLSCFLNEYHETLNKG